MINELYALYQSLQKCGIRIGSPHQYIKSPARAEGYIIGVDQDGLPQTVHHIDAENMAKLWTLRNGQHNSFPYLRLKIPILDVKYDDSLHEMLGNKKITLEEKKKTLVSAIAKYPLRNGGDLNLTNWTQNQLEAIKNKDQKLSALFDLVKRLPRGDERQKLFLKKLSELLVTDIKETTIGIIKTVLIGNIKKKEKKIHCDAPLFLDVDDWEKYLCRVAHPEMGLLVGKYLPDPTANKKEDGISAFGNKGLHVGPYPELNLRLFRASLCSMNKDALCHDRYRKIGSEIFPASREEVKGINGTVDWCLAKEREGKTWKRVPSYRLATVNGKKVRVSDLAITFLEDKPQAEIELASTFAGFDVTEEEVGEAIYEKKATAVCNALRGEAGLTEDSRMNILVITKIDKGRAQVVMNVSYSIGNLIKSVEEWQIASRNRPKFSMLLPGKKGEKGAIAEASCPSPGEAMRCFQNQWIRNGFEKSDIPGVHLRHVYDLFLGKGRIAQETARMLLQLVLQRLGPLFLGIAAIHHSDGDVTKSPIEARKTVLTGISVLAIILYKLEIKKEDYMGNPAFNIGRLLAFADGLHAQYCKLQMKKEQLPPQLMGNAVMRAALDNPTQALSLLAQRIAPYHAWATKVQGKDYALVKWFLGEMGQISSALGEAELPTATDDTMKAQILLGYLARSKSEE